MWFSITELHISYNQTDLKYVKNNSKKKQDENEYKTEQTLENTESCKDPMILKPLKNTEK